MKVTQFKGRIPRLASRLLPDNFSEVCTNARLKSGDLESWKGNTTVDTPSKAGTTHTIFPLDLYGRYTAAPGPWWLHWSTAANSSFVRVAKSFAKPPSDDATKERIFFTVGTDRPQWTDIDAALDGSGTDYPLTSYRLGVRAPTDAPVIASVTVAADPTIDAEYDGTNLGGWKTSQFEPNDTENVVGINAGEFELKANQLSGLNKAVYMARDDGFGAAYYSRMRCKFRLTASSASPNDGWLMFCYGCDEDGAGNVIGLQIRSDNTGSVFFGSQSSWDTPSLPAGLAMSGTPTLGTDYFLSVEVSKSFSLDRSTEVTITVKVGTTLGDDGLFSRSFTTLEVTDNGGGVAIPPSFNDPGGNPVAKARYVIRPSINAGAFWYGFSLTTFATSNGPHVSYVDDIDLALVGADVGEGVSVTRYALTWVNSKGEESAPGALSAIVPDDPELTINLTDLQDPSLLQIQNYAIVGKRLYRAVTGDGVTLFRLVVGQTVLAVGAQTGQLASATTTTAVLDASASSTDDAYNGLTITITGGTATGSTGVVTDYDGATRTATVGSWSSGTPDGTSTYSIDYTAYADGTATEDLSLVVLESQDWSEPPTTAQDVIALANGILLLVDGNHVYPSQPYRPHAYILSQAKTTDWPIVGGVAVENMAVLCTEECPYLMYGDDPAAMSLDKVERAAGCASQRSIVRYGRYGVVYASWEGIIAVQGKNAVNLTNPEDSDRAIFTDEQWRDYDPSSMQFAVYDDQLFVFWNNGVTSGAFIFNPAYGIVDLEMTATAVYVDPIRNRLFAMVGSNIVEFNTGSDLETTWRQGIRQLPYPMVFTAAQVRAPSPDNFPANVVFNVYRNGENTPYDTATVDTDTEFRLLADDSAVAREIQMEAVITGGAVNSLEIAEDIDGLT